MIKVREGDLAQASVLFERYSGRLYNFFVRLTYDRALSKDLTQNVFDVCFFSAKIRPGRLGGRVVQGAVLGLTLPQRSQLSVTGGLILAPVSNSKEFILNAK